MTTVVRRAPDPGEIDLDALLTDLSAVPCLPAGSEVAVEACAAVSRTLLHDPRARRRPDLVALASWLRPANTRRVVQSMLVGPTRVPRGLAFHVAPANVDPIAMYSLALSMLAGNRSIVRISSRSGEGAELICAAVHEALSDPRLAPIRAGTALLSWDHDSDATALCSSACDVRLIWGGDETVRALRALATRPGATDVSFFDRFSLAAIRAGAWQASDEADREELVRRLRNDTYWFDQQGCSSPRLLVWCGDEPDVAAASEDLFSRLALQLRDDAYELPLGAVTQKFAWIAGAAIDRPLSAVRTWSNELSVLRLATLDDLDRNHPGGGVFLEARVGGLTELAEHVTRRDQTLAVYGFDRRELDDFVAAAAGRGVDRIVPFGDALRFEPQWDGIDMLTELTKQVVISPDAARSAVGVIR